MQDKDRLLRTFLVVAQSGSLRKAADMLDLTPPAVSKQISALEAWLGSALFTRDGRGMMVTPLGHRLAERAGSGFGQLDAALDDARASAHAPRSVSIATVNTLAAYLVPKVLASLRESNPLLTARVDNASAPDVVEHVTRGQSDLGLVYDMAVDTDAVRMRRLYVEELSAYCAASALPASVHSLSAAELATHPFVAPPRPYAMRRVLERELPGPLNVAAEANSVSVLLDLAAIGIGMALLPSALPDFMIAPRGLRRLSISGAKLGRQVALIHRPDARPGKAIEAALQAIEAYAARLA
ncbi:LysR family transcriptional regulator [Variovorax robiniae]|uniref:LysR family transcriptional regulator n=1 Tax=Variovorax robiniae TaxID=1836199 RepID=A0ABU8XEW7_9BURK